MSNQPTNQPIFGLQNSRMIYTGILKFVTAKSNLDLVLLVPID